MPPETMGAGYTPRPRNGVKSTQQNSTDITVRHAFPDDAIQVACRNAPLVGEPIEIDLDVARAGADRNSRTGRNPRGRSSHAQPHQTWPGICLPQEQGTAYHSPEFAHAALHTGDRSMRSRERLTGLHAARYSDEELGRIVERQGLRTPRSISQIHGVATAARIQQNARLLTQSIVLSEPMLVFVQHGYKIISTAACRLEVHSGEAVLIEAAECMDVENVPDEDGRYQAQWITFDNQLLTKLTRRAAPTERPVATPVNAPNSEVQEVFLDTFERVCEVVLGERLAPSAVGEARVIELLAWVEEFCGYIPQPARPSITYRVRELLMEDLSMRWTADQTAQRLGLSEATFRRRLAQEGTSHAELLLEMRMGQALRLLQSTDMSVLQVSFSVGYDSPSKFASRFRSRYGFAPSSLRMSAAI